MEKNTTKRMAGGKSARTKIAGSRGRVVRLFVTVLIGAAVVVVAVRAYNHATSERIRLTNPAMPSPLLQGAPGPHGKSFARLSHQPEAERVRRVLGPRFLTPGREKAILVGVLTVGAEANAIRIVRTQNDNGEQVEIGIGAGPSNMTWNPVEGARVDGRPPSSVSRSIIERLALDSPDEFVLAQLRGASYYTVARNVMPKSAAGSVDYNGPTWDVVRVGEPQAAGPDQTLSKARAFHINTTT